LVIPRKGNDVAHRTCEVAGCGKAHTARGLCTTHYNKLILGAARRHPKVEVPCGVCGATVLRRKDKLGINRPTCSVSCRNVVQWGRRLAMTDTYAWQMDAIKRAQEYGARIVDRFDRAEIFERDDWSCQVCGVACTLPDPYTLTAATIDHVVPLSEGGDHSRANARTCCLSCNSAQPARQAA
jgi:5-methylcytosine-specific restriction endonuclease McrA